jgi:hypothetical protein
MMTCVDVEKHAMHNDGEEATNKEWVDGHELDRKLDRPLERSVEDVDVRIGENRGDLLLLMSF